MKFLATVAGKEYAVDLQPGGSPGAYTVSVDGGPPHEVDIEPTARDWLYSLLLDGRSDQIGRTDAEVHVDGVAYAVEVERDLGLRRAAGPGASAGPARVKAPIPGLVVAVNVAPGSEVREGQALLVLEAMKMQMELKSPRSGHVLEIGVQAGQEVAQGQALAVIGD